MTGDDLTELRDRLSKLERKVDEILESLSRTGTYLASDDVLGAGAELESLDAPFSGQP